VALTDVNDPQPERDSDAEEISVYTVPDRPVADLEQRLGQDDAPSRRSRHRAAGAAHRRRSRTPLVMVSALVASAGLGSAVALLQRPDSADTREPVTTASGAPSRIVDSPPALTESPVPLNAEGGSAGGDDSAISGSTATDEATASSGTGSIAGSKAGATDSSAGGSNGSTADSRPRATADPGGRDAEQKASARENRSAAVQSAAPAPFRISELADRPTRAGSWPPLTYTLQASASSDEPLRFPTSVPGYRLSASAVSRVELEESRYFTPVGRLAVRTASYDECKATRFYIRWIATDPDAVVESSFVDEAVATLQNQPVSGAAGWQSSYGCVQPALRIRPGSSGPENASVIIETQTWKRRG